MARFHFKLQKVLEAKRSFEDVAKREFGEAKRHLMKMEEILEQRIDKREDFIQEMAQRRLAGSTVQEFREDINLEWRLRIDIRDQKFLVKKAQNELEKKREILVQAMKERKIMERLREKRLQEFKENLNADEIKFSDDIAGRKAHFEEKVMGKV